jgi:uncharacterized protein (TIGR00369 family)
MTDPKTRDTVVELPTDIYDKLGSNEDEVAETLTTVAIEQARLQESVETYANRDDDSPVDFSTVPDTQPPIAELVGFELEAVEEGEAILSLQPGPEHANPMGTLHGGVLCDIGDAAMGYAYASTLSADESFTTLELDVKFRRPVWEQPLTATGRVVDAGRTVGLVECDITRPDGKLVAHLEGVNMTLRDDQAAGR